MFEYLCFTQRICFIFPFFIFLFGNTYYILNVIRYFVLWLVIVTYVLVLDVKLVLFVFFFIKITFIIVIISKFTVLLFQDFMGTNE